MSVDSVSDARPGPPPVITQTWSKSFSPPMIDSIRLTVIAGARAGRTMYQNRATGPAPSTWACSSTSAGMPCSPARKMTIE